MRTSDRVFEEIRDAIVSGGLEAGSLHSIYNLAVELGVSRTPVRDAVLRLADLGLVSIERNRGIRIRGLAVDDLRAIFELRLMVEVPAAAAAAGFGAAFCDRLDARILAMETAFDREDLPIFLAEDRGLHDDIMSALVNPRATGLVGSLRDATQAMGASTLDGSRGMREIHSEHIPIVDAIRAGDGRTAASAMARHLISTADLLMAQAAAHGGGTANAEWSRHVAPCFSE